MSFVFSLALLLVAAQEPAGEPPVTAPRQSITVEGQVTREQESATVAPVTSEQLKRLPTDPPSVREALPLIPGVLRTPEGRLRLSGSAEYRSTMLVNSADVTDPATGKFGATVPIDAVLELNVLKNPFLAEYGRFTAAVVIVETKKGGDKWHAELNDPTPELRIRSRHIRGVRGFTPRLSFSGPLIRNKLYLSESGEYRLNKTPVFTLPFPYNESKRESWNTLTQLDYIASNSRLLTATVHLVPEKIDFANLNFYNPQPVTPSFHGREFHAAISYKATFGSGVLESDLAATEVTSKTGAQADTSMTLTPTMNLGSYFARERRRARRYQWLEAWSWTSGAHHLKAGSTLIHSTLAGSYSANTVSIVSPAGGLLHNIDFSNGPPFQLDDMESGSYLQDHWQLKPALSFDGGVRLDWQRRTGLVRLAPRFALAWAPFGDSDTVVRAGYGWFYDRVPLVVYAYGNYPARNIDGLPFANYLGAAGPSGALVFGSDRPGSFAPRSHTWSAHVEQLFGHLVRLRAGYTESRSSGLLVLDPKASAISLTGNGQGHYRQFETLARVSYEKGQELMFSYVYSRSRGNLNEFDNYLGDYASPLVRPDVYARMPADTPHRLLIWGVIPFNEQTRIAPVIEYRTGLPYAALDVAQDYSGVPNSLRFPNFFSLDFRVGRDIHVRKHAVQISFSMFNVTNHWNPDTVRLNVADPQFGEFLGQHRRRFRLDFDFLF